LAHQKINNEDNNSDYFIEIKTKVEMFDRSIGWNQFKHWYLMCMAY